MKKLFLLVMWILLLVFSLASFYISYSSFITEREKKISENLVAFLSSFPERKIVPIPYPELTVLKVKKGYEFFATANAVNPIDLSQYEVVVRKVGQTVVELYTKRPTFDDFLIFLLGNPVFLSLLAFIFVIYLSFYYFTLKELEKPGTYGKKKEEFPQKEELIGTLKALKILLHTERILKEESRQKAKVLLDELIKKLENN
ncbi:MAG: hypothetical protein GXN96_03950 [Aquificae bacterium]|nr:hypothetical protein [Aquificota bacterium]